jgi:hypothetical protein
MHPIWRISIGVVLTVIELLQPHHGFALPITRYHDYNNPHLYAGMNAFVALIYLALIALTVSGLTRIVLAGKRQDRASKPSAT